MPDREMFDWDCYSILGVKPDATTAEIKSAWKRLQKMVHPDRAVPGDEADRKAREETSKRVNGAWQMLGNERTRREYDAHRARQGRTAPAPGPAGPPAPGRGGHPGGIDIDIDLEDLLRRARRPEPPKEDRQAPRRPHPGPGRRGPTWNPGYEPPRPGGPRPSAPTDGPRRPPRAPGESGPEKKDIDLDEMLRHVRRGRWPGQNHPETPERPEPRWNPEYEPPLRPRAGGPRPSPTDGIRPRGPDDRPPDDPGRRPRRSAEDPGPRIDETSDLGGGRRRPAADRLQPEPDWSRKKEPRDFRARPEHAPTRDGADHERRHPADGGGLKAARNRNARRQPHGTPPAPPVRGAGRPVGGGHRTQPPGTDRIAPGRA